MFASRRTAKNRHIWRFTTIILSCLLVGGCGDGKDRLKTYPTQGIATFQGKSMQGAIISLNPIEGEAKAKDQLPRGIVGEDGTYTVGTYQDGDGAPVGRYKVTIQWCEAPDPATGPDQAVPDRLKGRYANPAKSDIEVTITEGDNTLPPIELR
ncbi:MAG: carboxypeptidase regulatory-like domain-containing protein [Pirellulales bacterium]|nr:carboxypeptidase regulatory-like domain-containing protein [Pirellulales bacterium]